MEAVEFTAVDIDDRSCRGPALILNSRMERNMMLQKISIFIENKWKSVVRFVAAPLMAICFAGWVSPLFAQQQGQRTFASAQEAGHALFAAMQAQGDQAPLSILGQDGKDLLSSGDPAEDADARVGFVIKYEEMHRYVTEPDRTVTMVVGAENWPFPIPLVLGNGSWYFDTPAGKEEILFRRIGSNELTAISASHDLVEAQREYFARPHGDLSKEFAKKLVSDKGRHNGLYWNGAYNEADSLLNPEIAYANKEGSMGPGGDPIPFKGYFFRVLFRQGSHAPGGAKNYILDGKMMGGFAFVAYPAQYRSSGVMTFIVDESGTVFEKDLGPDTTKLAEAMTAYDPDSTWHQPE
jgi:hypothetical protein